MKRCLVIKLADLGDALTATPALRSLRTTYPDARIDVLVTAAGGAALAGLDSVDRIWTFEKAQFDRFRPRLSPIIEALRLGFRLRTERYDRVFLFHHLFTSAGRVKYGALLGAIGSSWRGGVSEAKPPFLTEFVRDRGYGVQHEADYWLEAVGLAGARPLAIPRLEIAIDSAARSRARRLLDDRPGPRPARVAMYPGSGAYSEGRRWSAAGYIAVGQSLAADPGVELLVVGSAAELELADRICARTGPTTRNLAGKTDLKALAAVLATCDLVIGNDGGVTHVAVAAGAPVIAIFGPTNHVSWGPFQSSPTRGLDAGSPLPIVVRRDLPCSPCLYRGFLPGTPRGCQSHDCLKLIEPEQVIAQARHLLKASGNRIGRISESRKSDR